MAVKVVNLPFQKVASGKVREIFRIDDSRLRNYNSCLLMVNTDRISAFDVVMNSLVARGESLTRVSNFWFNCLSRVCPNHLLPKQDQVIWEVLGGEYPEYSRQCTVVRALKMVPFEFIVRSHLTGSAYEEYLKNHTVSGVAVAKGLKRYDRIPNGPFFSVTTKAQSGHDQSVSFEQLCDAIGKELAAQIRELTLKLFVEAQAVCKKKHFPGLPHASLTLGDAKLEFGLWNGQLMWGDEAFTPDCSRYWFHNERRIVHLSKQLLRDYLSELMARNKWDGKTGADLPKILCHQMEEAYLRLNHLLTI